MKSNSKIFALCLFLATLSWAGCNYQQPTSAGLSTAPTIDRYALLNISNSTCVGNSNIIGSTSATVQITCYGTPVTVCHNAPIGFQLVPSGQEYYSPTGGYISGVPFAPGGGSASQSYTGGCPQAIAAGAFNFGFNPTGLTDGFDQYGVHVTGYLNDPENPTYPPGAGNLQNIQIELFPAGASSAYDVSQYQGIQFYIYISPVDSIPDRVFNAYVQQQVPTGTTAGVCNNQALDPTLTHCYDGFEYDYTNSPRGQWVLIQKNWGDLKQYGFGSITSPPTFSGANLKALGFFSWAEASTGASGPMTIDYCISGVRFF